MLMFRASVADGLTYGKYVVVGVIVGIVTIAAREALGATLPADTPVFYATSAFTAYALGIVLSYLGHGKLTFSSRPQRIGGFRRFYQFTGVALLGLGATAALAPAIRYGLNFDRIAGPYGAGLAFALAALFASIGTYLLHSRYVFGIDAGDGECARVPRDARATRPRSR
jgi:putative flippase GtrA